MGRYATLLSQGMGVVQDEDEAARWYRKAWEEGSIEGLMGVGECAWLEGNSGQDWGAGERLILQAANAGCVLAMTKLGFLYADPERPCASPESVALGVHLLRKAAATGDPEGMLSWGLRLAELGGYTPLQSLLIEMRRRRIPRACQMPLCSEARIIGSFRRPAEWRFS
jgi:TPR repeat protein